MPVPTLEPPPGMVTLTTASAETGVSASTIYRWAKAGRIPAVQMTYGRRLFVKVEDVRGACQLSPVVAS